MSGTTASAFGITSDDTDESAWVKTERAFAAMSIRCHNIVIDLCSLAGLPPLQEVDTEKWQLLLMAVQNKTPLRSHLPTRITKFSTYEDVAPTRPRGADYNPEDLTMLDEFKRLYDHIKSMQNRSAQPPHTRFQSWYESVPRHSWYATRQRQVANVLRWLGTEAGPIVDALVEAGDHRYGALEISQLQEHLAQVQEAYAEEVTQATRNVAAQDAGTPRAE